MLQNSSTGQATGDSGSSHDRLVLSERPEANRVDVARTLAVCVSLVVCGMVFLQIARFDAALAIEPHTAVPDAIASKDSKAKSESKRAFRTELLRGQVVWLADALKTEFGISTMPEVAKNSLAVLTKDGQLLPIVENLRGRAFRKDERLREKDMEILTRRYENQPLIQILRVYQIEDGKRFEVDYWCDICAIVMFETGPCACCQDDNRLRKRLVEDDEMD